MSDAVTLAQAASTVQRFKDWVPTTLQRWQQQKEMLTAPIAVLETLRQRVTLGEVNVFKSHLQSAGKLSVDVNSLTNTQNSMKASRVSMDDMKISFDRLGENYRQVSLIFYSHCNIKLR